MTKPRKTRTQKLVAEFETAIIQDINLNHCAPPFGWAKERAATKARVDKARAALLSWLGQREEAGAIEYKHKGYGARAEVDAAGNVHIKLGEIP